jgi:hypothetical protein
MERDQNIKGRITLTYNARNLNFGAITCEKVADSCDMDMKA